jgi:glycerol-3-phosphate dehydrogenase (NAD(P)+)
MALAAAARRAGTIPAIWSRRGNFTRDEFDITGDDRALGAIDLLLLAIPAQEMEAVAKRLAPNIAPALPIVACAKGIVHPGDRLLEDVLAEALPARPFAVLSGPSFAAEVMRSLPTAVTVASRDAQLAQRVAVALGSPTFRPYISDDPMGVQLGGAVKNVIAIACGIVAGREAGENARAALMTRGLAEMARLGQAMGAKRDTFAGLAGLGDLSLTATSPTSRNFRLGMALGRNVDVATARAGIDGVIEGMATAPAVVAMAGRKGVEMPISAAVAGILRGDDIGMTMTELLARPLRIETA